MGRRRRQSHRRWRSIIGRPRPVPAARESEKKRRPESAFVFFFSRRSVPLFHVPFVSVCLFLLIPLPVPVPFGPFLTIFLIHVSIRFHFCLLLLFLGRFPSRSFPVFFLLLPLRVSILFDAWRWLKPRRGPPSDLAPFDLISTYLFQLSRPPSLSNLQFLFFAFIIIFLYFSIVTGSYRKGNRRSPSFPVFISERPRGRTRIGRNPSVSPLFFHRPGLISALYRISLRLNFFSRKEKERE